MGATGYPLADGVQRLSGHLEQGVQVAVVEVCQELLGGLLQVLVHLAFPTRDVHRCCRVGAGTTYAAHAPGLTPSAQTGWGGAGLPLLTI